MSSTDLIQPPPQIDPPTSLHLSQQAPQILRSSSGLSLPWPLSLLTSSETQETWTTYENLLVSCLRTGDNASARKCLDALLARFGAKNERVMALRGMYDEATAADDAALKKVLDGYEAALKEDATNMPIRKRRVALLRSKGKISEATAALVELVDVSPTDVEAWAELAELYSSQGMSAQAIYCLEEVLLILPNAWNMHARLGEAIFISATASDSADRGSAVKGLSDALRRFCRSIELCDNYLRGFYGLKLTAKKLLEVMAKGGKGIVAALDDDPPTPSIATVEKLHEAATLKLAEIVRKASSREKGWEGYEEAELTAARALLDKDEEKRPR